MKHVVFPMLLPSIVAGSVFTFSLTLGDYIAVGLVGGKTQMIGSIVYSNFASNLPLASAYAVVPVLIMIVYLLSIRRSRFGRIVLVLAWWWVGWHLFVR